MKGERISFGQLKEVMPIPDLIGIQTKSFADFLQKDVAPDKRKKEGLQSVFRDMFPRKSDGSRNYSGIEFIEYEVVEGDSDLPELLKSGKNYEASIYAKFRMQGNSQKDIRDERILMGKLPLMTPSGSFIINGSERVIVSQLHRSPGICFERTRHASGKELYSYKVIADHGSWIEVQFDPKDKMNIYLDRKRRRRKFLISTFMRAFGYNSDVELLDAIYGIQTKSVKELLKDEDLVRYTLVDTLYDPRDPERKLADADSLAPLNEGVLRDCQEAGIKEIRLVQTDELGDYFIKCLDDDAHAPVTRNGKLSMGIRTTEDAQIEIYKRLRPSPNEAVSAASAKAHFERIYLDERHYDLGQVGRYKMNQRLGIDVPADVHILTKEDLAAATRLLMRLAKTNGTPDDIDHLSRRRIRTIGELLQKACRVGLAHVSSNAITKLNNLTNSGSELPPLSKLINAKQFDGAIQDFFQHNQLSQFMDQTNCLSELTNKRRLSALGPGGLTRDRAGTEVRDVHASHYGRICPIETPEGPNIGLISSLALYAHLDEFGFIETPYCRVKGGKVVMDKKGNPEIVYLKAAEEEEHVIAQANAPRNPDGSFKNERVLGRFRGEAGDFPRDEVEFVDISPKQMISAAASVITFLEHDDANRALMGCNMQRQAVPLMRPERPLVGTGMEGVIAAHSHAIQAASRPGIVAWADGCKIIVTPDGKLPKGKTADDYTLSCDTEECQVYILYKFLRSNACTLVNQRPIVVTGQKVTKGQPLADGACTDEGELALGRNVLVAFMSWRGYNFEDAIVISEKLQQDDVFTSVHINLQQVEARESRQGGRDEITRDIPNTKPEMLKNLDTEGVIRIGAEVQPGDFLVGKVSPKAEGELEPTERLWHAIFGEKSTDVKPTCLVAEPGNDGVVMDLRVSRTQDPTKIRVTKQELKQRQQETRQSYENDKKIIIENLVKELGEVYLGQKLSCDITVENPDTKASEELIPADRKITKLMLNKLANSYDRYQMRDGEDKRKIDEIVKRFRGALRDNEQCCKEAIELLQKNNGSDPGTINEVKVYIASKRRLDIGDKLSGRHGNKGIVSKVASVADLPFMADGTPVEIVLNPVGVPSRMNIGQVFETHVGWAAKILGINVATPSFDGLREETMRDLLERARLVKVAEAAGVAANIEELPAKLRNALRKVDGPEVENAKRELRRLIEEKGWKLGERDDEHCTGGFILDEQGIDRTDDFVDIDGKTRLYDGRTGDAFAQRVMVGQIYMLKLDHLVVNKIHARATGKYSLVTQQPLGGKAHHGGQRFGEMEVWALEAYGAAYTLQEMLTVKSDDQTGRYQIFKNISRFGNATLIPGVPESFNVLRQEMKSLCLDIRVNSRAQGLV